jgi:transposase-like protein
MFNDKIFIMEQDNSRRSYKITPQMRADIIAQLIVGNGVNEVARQHQISKAAVSKIKSELDDDSKKLIPSNSDERIEDLLVDSLKHHLKALNKIAQVAQDEIYILNQSAGQIADLHQQLASWSLQILSAADPER